MTTSAATGAVDANRGHALADNSARIEQFRSEIEELGVKGGGAQSEKWLLVLGSLLLVVGVVLGILGAVQVINAGDSPANQRAYMASGSLLGIVLVIVGTAVFVRYSLARFMRFWLIRMVHEGHADTDRIVAAIEAASAPIDTTSAPQVPGSAQSGGFAAPERSS